MASSKPTDKSETTRFLEAAKDFSFEQKLSVVQSILANIPREQQKPWNVAQPSIKLAKTSEGKKQHTTLPNGTSAASSSDGKITVVNEKGDNAEIQELVPDEKLTSKVLQSTDDSVPKYQAPPLIDPYEKSMRYYEKHVVLNHFQHMTAKLVLNRPENTLQFMIDWCKDMQKKQEETRLKSKTLYEQSKIDVYDDETLEPLQSELGSKHVMPANKGYGARLLKEDVPSTSMGGDMSTHDTMTENKMRPAEITAESEDSVSVSSDGET